MTLITLLWDQGIKGPRQLGQISYHFDIDVSTSAHERTFWNTKYRENRFGYIFQFSIMLLNVQRPEKRMSFSIESLSVSSRQESRSPELPAEVRNSSPPHPVSGITYNFGSLNSTASMSTSDYYLNDYDEHKLVICESELLEDVCKKRKLAEDGEADDDFLSRDSESVDRCSSRNSCSPTPSGKLVIFVFYDFWKTRNYCDSQSAINKL
jgi:hypothetical protein